MFPNLIFVFSILLHPGFIFTGILFLIYLWFSREWGSVSFIMIVSLLLYTLFLAGLPMQNQRLLLLAFPLILILYFTAWVKMMETLGRWKILLIIFIVIIQTGLCYKAFIPFYHNSHEIRMVAERMKDFPKKKIYTLNIDMAFPAYGLKNETVNLWASRIDHFEPGSLVLINSSDLSNQWKGMNPMINLKNISNEYSIRIIEYMKGGWILYEICQ